MSKRAEKSAELIANGIMINVQGRTGRVIYNTKEKSFDHHDLMSAARKGYEQAEKDLALTWEDIAKIITIYEAEIANGDYRRYNEAEWMKEYSQDILRRFNEMKGGRV